MVVAGPWNPESEDAALPAGSVRAVIIDDTADLRSLLRLALPLGGFDVVGEAEDGKAGIRLVRATLPDLVLLDLAMPVMDGLEALPILRRTCPTATIVVLSGFGADQMAERALAAGADGYMRKGTPLDAMFAQLRSLTDGRARARSGRRGRTP